MYILSFSNKNLYKKIFFSFCERHIIYGFYCIKFKPGLEIGYRFLPKQIYLEFWGIFNRLQLLLIYFYSELSVTAVS